MGYLRFSRAWSKLLAGLLVVGLLAIVACQPAVNADRPLVYGSITEPNTLNPLLAPDIPSRQALDLVYDGLVAATDTLELAPRLAEKWDTSADGKTWTFHLRQNVKWSDGQSFTASDVVYTYRALLDPKSGATLARGEYAVLDRVEAPDSSTVVFTLKKLYAPFLSRLTVGIVPEHLLKDLAGQGKDLASAPINRQPVGTGPYTLKEWQSGQSLTFVANPSYYLGKPVVSQIIWKVVPDSSTLTLQLLARDSNGVSAALVADPQDRAKARADERYRAAESFAGATQISFRLTNPLFQDVRVRRALALGLDAPALIAGVMEGEAKPAISDIPPSSWAYDTKIAPIARDLETSARLFAEAGWTKGTDGIYAKDGKPFAFTLATYAGDRVREATLLAVQQQWKDLGVSVAVSTQERNSFVANKVLKGDFDAVLLESSVQVDPDLSRRFHSASIQAGQNFVAYQNPAVDMLLDRGVATVNRDDRRQIYSELERQMLDDLPQIPLFHATQAYAFPVEIGGVRPSPNGPFWNVAEWKLGAAAK